MIFKQPVAAATLFVISCTLLACSSNTTKPSGVASPDTGHYSVRSYIHGQILSLYGQPTVLERRLITGAGLDSSLIPMAEADWNEVLPLFAESDISDPANNGLYDFSVADDNITGSRILTYTAKRPDLFTQLFQINTDPLNYKAKNIYIETRKSGFWRKQSHKLLYIPHTIIQIQETIDPLIGSTQQRRLEYIFPGDPSNDVHIVEEEQ